MPGVWVFPGGAVDESERWPAGSSDALSPTDENGRTALRRSASRGGGRDRAGGRRRPAPVVAVDHARGRPDALDTRYVALAPPHSPPRPDGPETVDAQRFPRRGPLDMHAADELELVSTPTIKHLESLLPYASLREVLDAVDAVEPVLPKVIERASRSASPSRAIPGTRTKIRGQVTSTLPQEVRDVFERFVAVGDDDDDPRQRRSRAS